MWAWVLACQAPVDSDVVDTDVVDTDVADERFADVTRQLDVAFAANDVAIPGLGLRVYDAEDRLVYAHTAGAFSFDDRLAVASASKLVSGLVLLKLVHDGALLLDDTTADHLGWTGGLGEITVDQLGAFTSGLDPENPCVYRSKLTLEGCVATIGAADPVAGPGSRFDYGSTHLQVAGRIAEVATGASWHEAFVGLAAPLGLADPGLVYTSLPKLEAAASPNPLVAGGLRATSTEYAAFLALAFHEGRRGDDVLIRADLVHRLDRNDYIAAVQGERPTSVVPLDYRYGFTSWLACEGPVATCPVVGSPGAYGFTPWFDREHGYYAILAMESPELGGSEFAVPLWVDLQAAIGAAIGRDPG